MSWFQEEAFRLLRESWPDPNLLAEELYAIFRSDNPTKVTTPTTFGNGDTATPVTITLPPGGNFTINNTNGCTALIGFDDNCNLTINGVPPGSGGGGDTGGGGGGGGGVGGGGLLGQVLSGSGDTYQVQIDGGGAVTATVPGIDSGETVPPYSDTGQEYPLYKMADGTYKLIVPLWI